MFYLVLFSSIFAIIISLFFSRLTRAANISIKGHGSFARFLFYLNFAAFWIYFWASKRLSKRKSLKIPLDKIEQSMLTSQDDWNLENPQKSQGCSDHVQFGGFDSHGNMVFIDLVANESVQLILKYNGVIYELQNAETYYHNQGDSWFSAGGLRLENRHPFRKWKINFRGYLSSIDNANERRFVKISVWWAAISEVFDFWDDTEISNFAKAAAESTAPYKQTLRSLQRLSQCHHYHQFGQIFGQFYIEGVTETEQEVLFRGPKIRDFGDVQLRNDADWCKMCNLYFKDGTCIHLSVAEMNNFETPFSNSWMVLPKGEIKCIQWFDIEQFSSGKQDSVGIISESDEKILINFETLETCGTIAIENCSLCNQKGYGVTQILKKRAQKHSAHKESPSEISLSTISAATDLAGVIPLSHAACLNPEVSGGKASNLAKLMQLQLKFTVPNGICITTYAYDEYLETIGIASKSLMDLESQNGTDSIDQNSESLSSAMAESKFPSSLTPTISAQLERLFGDDWMTDKKFAVRSSAVGEDSSELSTAGQLETFLYISGLENICDAVKKCWASNFRREVVEYRRQHGQSLTASVAVVVQEMIDPEIAGVLFTQDPVSGDPEKMIINASPGCGEAVVSGDVNPDTVIVRRDPFSGLVLHKELASLGNVCLADGVAMNLGSIGLYLEESLNHTPQDIEWAFRDSQIYVLQTRPITSFDVETEWELLHEFDSGTTAETDCYTTANLGEVLPDAVTPLMLDLYVWDAMQQYTQMKSGVQKSIFKYYKAGFSTYRNRIFFNVLKAIFQDISRMEDTTVPELCIFGHLIEDKRIKEAASYRYPFRGILAMAARLKYLLNIVLFWGAKTEKEAIDAFANFKLPLDAVQDPMEICIIIEDNLWKWIEPCIEHIHASMKSSVGFSILASIRKSGEPWTPEVLADVAALYADCQNVVSAEIPDDLKKIAAAVIELGYSAEFLGKENDEALSWLNSPYSEGAGVAYRCFLAKHGHRGHQESDIGAKVWWQNPGQLVDNIKQLLQSHVEIQKSKPTKSVDDTLDSLNSSLGSLARLLFKWAIPYARKAVASRETTKGLAMKVTDQFRRGFLQLGTVLHIKGYLPDPDLVFFLTFHELKELIRTRSGKLVARAVRRRKIVPKQNSCMYPELIQGQPLPVEKETRFSTSQVVVKGTGVCQGYVEGVVRVAHSLADTKEIKSGEILITRSTDISWSPLFPIIDGLVTELGGLLSHGSTNEPFQCDSAWSLHGYARPFLGILGAVVAREYGLPCMIGAENALESFENGDLAILDTRKGTIEKVSKN